MVDWLCHPGSQKGLGFIREELLGLGSGVMFFSLVSTPEDVEVRHRFLKKAKKLIDVLAQNLRWACTSLALVGRA